MIVVTKDDISPEVRRFLRDYNLTMGPNDVLISVSTNKGYTEAQLQAFDELLNEYQVPNEHRVKFPSGAGTIAMVQSETATLLKLSIPI